MRTNTEATILARSMKRTTEKLSTAQAQVASGLQNPDPAKDPYASTISKKLSTDISAVAQVKSVTSGAKSVIGIALNALNSGIELLNQMKTIAIKTNATILSPANRATMDATFQQKISQFDSIAHTTWGARTLFDGTFSMKAQTGTETTEITTLTLEDITVATILGTLDVTSQPNAQAAGVAIDAAHAILLDEINRLITCKDDFDHISENMETINLTQQGTLSEYHEVDFATAVSNSEHLTMLRDAGISVLQNTFEDFEKLSHLVGETLRK